MVARVALWEDLELLRALVGDVTAKLAYPVLCNRILGLKNVQSVFLALHRKKMRKRIANHAWLDLTNIC